MLQFNKSEATNKNAVYLDTVNTGSGYYGSLRIQYSQSFDNSNGTFTVTATSLPSAFRNWLVIENDGSDVPTPSGQYDVALYTATGSVGDILWSTWTETWTATSQTWSALTGSDTTVLQDLLYSDRAYISGSNETSITTYVSSNEDARYTTYNG